MAQNLTQQAFESRIRAYSLGQQLRNPVSARDWDDYAGRFVGAMWSWNAGGSMWDMSFMGVGMENALGETRELFLSWADIWVFYSLMKRLTIQEALAGPNGTMVLDVQDI
jgi:hypothetical protein